MNMILLSHFILNEVSCLDIVSTLPLFSSLRAALFSWKGDSVTNLYDEYTDISFVFIFVL